MLDNFYWLLAFMTYGFLAVFYPLLRKAITTSYYILLNTITIALLLVIHVTFAEKLFLHDSSIYFTTHNFLDASYGVGFSFAIVLNQLSWSFCLLVMVIALVTNIYLLTYFKGEGRENQFTFWLNSFVLSMLILILSSNFFTLFLGWELIGLTSFFLINFWNSRRATVKSSFKAFSFNTFSDLCLLVSISTLFSLTGCDDISGVLYLIKVSEYSHDLLFLASFFLAFCAATKSVQLGLHIWLPDSMEAPVPASALIHSATLVSAGIYLILRFNTLFLLVGLQPYLIFWGSITALVGGLSACAQTDLKKLLAYSTMSHCGFLWGLASLGNANICILYLFLHGLFKAATFFAAGSFIQLFGTQDMRWMRGGKSLNAETLLLLITSSNLCGLPFTIGYFYKDLTLALLSSTSTNVYTISGYMLAMLTSVVYFLKLNAFWMVGFNRTVKSDITMFMTFNRTKRLYGITAPNAFFAILVLFFTSICVVQFWYMFFNNFFLTPTLCAPTVQTVAITNSITPLLFYWFFVVVLLLVIVLNFSRASGAQPHMFFLLCFVFLLTILLFSLILRLIMYVSLHNDWSFLPNKL